MLRRQVNLFFFATTLLLTGGGGAFAAPAINQKKTKKEEFPLLNSARAESITSTPRLNSVLPPSVEAVDEQIHKGIKFLVDSQNADGSWGDKGNTSPRVNVLCPWTGGDLAFRAAVTALDVLGILTCAPEDAKAQAAIDKAEVWLIENLPKLRRPDDNTILNIWGHAYGLRALCELSQRVSPDSQTFADLKAVAQGQVDKLMDISDGGGGWGYYEFNVNSTRPNGLSTSFCTATALLSLKDAELTFGIQGNKKIIKKAVDFLYAQRTPAGTYLYSRSFYIAPSAVINRQPGSVARTTAANAALFAYGHKAIKQREIEDGLDWLWAKGGLMDIARKRPIPHEGPAKTAGYFFYYGYFYASENINMLSPDKRARHAAFLTHVMLPLQEKDGSWWDYPLYNYHKPYGTGYALYSLGQAREALYGSKAAAPLP